MNRTPRGCGARGTAGWRCVGKGLAVLVLIAACDRKAPNERPAPREGSAIVVPDVTTIDWRNQPYELASLGVVTAKNGRAEFWLVEDSGEMRATQSPDARGTKGSLVLAPAHFADLDNDGHDEAIIPFEMRSMHPDEAHHVFGAFAYTLREGLPLRIGVVTAESPIDVQGTTLSATDPPMRWTWSNGQFVPDKS
jgi:hypothetical protein